MSAERRTATIAGHVAFPEGDAVSQLTEPIQMPERELTQSEIETLLRDGVVKVEGALSQKWIKRIMTAVDEQASGKGASSISSHQSNASQNTSALTWLVNDKFCDIIMNCPTAHLAQQCLNAMAPGTSAGKSKEVRFFYDQMFVKWPSAGGKLEGNTPWHQDLTFWPVRGEEIVSVWCPMDRTTLVNGGLEFVPGSHKWRNRYKSYGVGIDFPSDVLEELPKLYSATNGDFDPSDPGAAASKGDVVTFDCMPGDVLIFSPLVLHGAPANRSTSEKRRALAFRYIGTDVIFDDLKHGPGTLLSPFNVFDESRRNGDLVAGPVYPKLLPSKVREEIEVRMQGPIMPSKPLIKAWVKKMDTLNAAAAAVVADAAALKGGSSNTIP